MIGKEAANSRVHGGYSLARAARYVRESARRVADQAELVVALGTESRQAGEGKAWLKIFQALLEIARENQRKVCEQWGVVPVPGASEERLGPQHHLTRAEHHVREGEQRVAKQADLVEMLERSGHSSLVPPARELLTTLQESLETARRHLRIERAAHAPVPACMGTRAAGCSQQQERS